MPWNVTLHPDLPVIEVTYSGWVPPEELDAAVRRSFEVAQQAQTGRVLTDCTRIQGGHTAFDLQKIAANLSALPNRHELREAVLVTGAGPNAVNTSYWEDACVVRGLQVRLFQDRDQALAWLMQ